MVLVAVCEHNGDHIVETVTHDREVGQNEVNARLVLLGEEHAAIDDEKLAVHFKNGHIPADLTEATDGRYPQRSRFERGRFVDVAWHTSSCF
ncbi:hypothetical protein GCM10022198_20640 [Klugiella xanthotipulae]